MPVLESHLTRPNASTGQDRFLGFSSELALVYYSRLTSVIGDPSDVTSGCRYSHLHQKPIHSIGKVRWIRSLIGSYILSSLKLTPRLFYLRFPQLNRATTHVSTFPPITALTFPSLFPCPLMTDLSSCTRQ